MGSEWCVIEFGKEKHIVPEDEIMEHFPTECRCQPVAELDDPGVIVHNSYDGREKFETGERKPS